MTRAVSEVLGLPVYYGATRFGWISRILVDDRGDPLVLEVSSHDAAEFFTPAGGASLQDRCVIVGSTAPVLAAADILFYQDRGGRWEEG